MHDEELVAKALRTAPRSKTIGHTYRVIDDEYRDDPLSGVGSVIRGERFNAPNSFEALYSSDSRVTALIEVEALFGDVDCPRSPEFVMTLDLHLNRTLDVMNPVNQALLGTDESELKQP